MEGKNPWRMTLLSTGSKEHMLPTLQPRSTDAVQRWWTPPRCGPAQRGSTDERDRHFVLLALSRPSSVRPQDVEFFVVPQGRAGHARTLRQLSGALELIDALGDCFIAPRPSWCLYPSGDRGARPARL
jgi:hypothetical protein